MVPNAGALIAKWRKPGYEILCSLLAIQKGNHNFGTTSHCRVPMKQRAQQQRITPDVQARGGAGREEQGDAEGREEGAGARRALLFLHQ
mgnify:CR=1 FL=1